MVSVQRRLRKTRSGRVASLAMDGAAQTDLLTLADIRSAAELGSSVVIRTSLERSSTFSRLCEREIWLKAEHLQRAGSFKIRGAMNALAAIEDASAGVVAASQGNHAQGVALAAATLGIGATVFMPKSAPIPKIQATTDYGAEIRLSGSNLGEAVDAAQAFSAETGARFVHPYDDLHIVAGQGTLGIEIAEDLPTAGTIVIPTGGGGLLAGVATAVKAISPTTRIVGVEAAATATYVASRAAGMPTPVPHRYTVADGIAVSRPSDLVFRHVQAYVDDIVTVDDPQMTRAVALLLERAKHLVEPAGAAGLAAVLDGLIPEGDGPTVVVLSGGNIDLLLLDRVLRHGLEAAGRFGSFRVRVPDVPGQLARLTNTVAELGANVVQVEHRREGIGLPFAFTEITISVETRGPEQMASIVKTLSEFDLEVLA